MQVLHTYLFANTCKKTCRYILLRHQRHIYACDHITFWYLTAHGLRTLQVLFMLILSCWSPLGAMCQLELLQPMCVSLSCWSPLGAVCQPEFLDPIWSCVKSLNSWSPWVWCRHIVWGWTLVIWWYVIVLFIVYHNQKHSLCRVRGAGA